MYTQTNLKIPDMEVLSQEPSHPINICYRIGVLGFHYKLLVYKPKSTDEFRN